MILIVIRHVEGQVIREKYLLIDAIFTLPSTTIVHEGTPISFTFENNEDNKIPERIDFSIYQ